MHKGVKDNAKLRNCDKCDYSFTISEQGEQGEQGACNAQV